MRQKPKGVVDKETGEIKGREFTEQELVAMLPQVYDLRRQNSQTANLYAKAKKPIGDWLAKHPDAILRDGENNITAFLQPRSGGKELDCMALAEKAPGLLLWLASHGCLRLDQQAFKALEGKAAEVLDIKPYIMPGEATLALVIDKEE